MKSITYLAVLGFLFVGACGDDGGGGGGGGADANQSSGLICSASNPCPDGQFCWNGLCALGCNSNDDCADDQYCDTEFDRLCHNKAVTICPDTPCADGQICRDGFCSTPPKDTSCTPRPDGNDGCDKFSICLDGETEGATACYSFPACDQNGECPTGTVGAVCNDGIIPNKAHICLTSLCQVVANCPSAWSCVKQTTDVVGFCSDGGFGAMCLGNDDCQDGFDCIQGIPGSYGICQQGF